MIGIRIVGALLQTASAFRIRICILGAAPHSVSVFRIRIPYFTSVFWVQLRIPYLYAVPHICILGADPYSVSVFRIRIYILGADPYSVFVFRIRICIWAQIRIPYLYSVSVFRILGAAPYSVSVFCIRILVSLGKERRHGPRRRSSGHR